MLSTGGAHTFKLLHVCLFYSEEHRAAAPVRRRPFSYWPKLITRNLQVATVEADSTNQSSPEEDDEDEDIDVEYDSGVKSDSDSDSNSDSDYME